MIITQSSKQPQISTEITSLKLYVFGSCQSDQYYHPKQQYQSKRPICLTDIEKFNIKQQDEQAQNGQKDNIISNPLFGIQISKITCGALHTVVSTTQGKVFTFGCNDQGALGRQGIQKIPIQVKLNHAIDLISAGDNHSIFASSGAGVIYFTGNYKYLRGQKMANPIRMPQAIDINQISGRSNSQSKLTKVVSGSNHSVILLGGRVFLRGQPEANTTGRRISNRNKQTSSLKFDGVGLNNVEDIWCGGYHSVAKLKKKNEWHYYGWGLNLHGQLGINNYEESPYPIQIKKLRGKNIIDIAAGTNFTIFLTEDGELLGCGQNDDGQLGLGQNYQYVDSQQQQQKKLQEQIKQKMQINEVKEDNKQQNKQQQNNNKQQNAQGHEQQIKKQGLKQHNVYIKSIKKIDIQAKLNNITAGSEFVYGWNQSNLYSWGFGSNYVLLNGNQQDQYQPFKVKSTIINQHRIYQLSAGAQHVAYLSYPKDAKIGKIELSQTAKKLAIQSRKKPNNRKKSPAKK